MRDRGSKGRGWGLEKIIRQESSVFGAFEKLRRATITIVMSAGNDSAHAELII